MELRQLRAFVTVASVLHFGQAAKLLHISQPAVSQRIRYLERELRISLFVRTTRGIHLTDAGRTFLPHAQGLIDREDRAMAEMRALTSGHAGKLRVGYYSTSSPRLTTELVRQFRQDFPGVAVEPSHANSALNLLRLREGVIDIGVVRLPMYELDGLDVCIIETGPYVLALPSDHRLCRESVVKLSDLGGERWIMYPRLANPGHFDYLVSTIEQLTGMPIHTTSEEPFEEAELAAVASGGGVCLFQLSSSKHITVEGVSFRPIVPPTIVAQLAVISMTHDRTTPAANFMAMVKERVARPRDLGPTANVTLKPASYAV